MLADRQTPRTYLSPLLSAGIASMGHHTPMGSNSGFPCSGWKDALWTEPPLNLLSFCFLCWALAVSVCLGAAIHLPISLHGKVEHPYNTWQASVLGVTLLPSSREEGNTVWQAPKGVIYLKIPDRSLPILSLWPCIWLVLKQQNHPTEDSCFMRKNCQKRKIFIVLQSS